MGLLFTYTGKAAETKEMIEEGKSDIIIDALYKHSRGFYWKINRRGYIHVIKPSKVTINGKFSHYEIEDRLLTKDNMLKIKSSYGHFQSILECIKEIESDLYKQ